MRRRFSADGVIHIYQRTVSGFNLFYSLEDFLVFYTIVSVQARKFGINMLGMCLMIDHTHLLAAAKTFSQLCQFISAYTSLYVREFNKRTGRSGPLFETPYGSALKLELKKIRAAIAYLLNNPVEKQLCPVAEEYKWNFLRYYDPDKKPTKRRKSSRRIQRSLKIIDEAFRNNSYLNYALLDNIFRNLDSNEKEHITDYIMSLYFPFKKDMPQKYFGSYEELVTAINSNTGSEYEITEKHYCKTDVPYREILRYLKTHGIKDPKTLITASAETKKHFFTVLRKNTVATPIQIRKYLHWEKE